MISLAVSLFACGTAPSEGTDAAGEEGPEVTVNAPPTEAEILAAGVPDLGPGPRATLALAKSLEVGAAHCPVRGSGLIDRVHGTMRDYYDALGPMLMVDAGDEPVSWPSIYDRIAVDKNWTAVLAEPGSTEAFVRLRDRTLKLTFPAAKAGEMVACTEVVEVPKRTVRGGLAKPLAEGQRAFVQGCRKMDPNVPGLEVAKDGTFVFEVETPCALWLDSAGRRTETIAVAPSTEKLELDDLVLAADWVQTDEGGWTEKGAARMTEITGGLRAMHTAETARLETLVAGFEEGDKARKFLNRYQREMRQWDGIITRLEKRL